MPRFIAPLSFVLAVAAALPVQGQDVPDALAEAVTTYADAVLAGDIETLDTLWGPEAYAARITDGLDIPEATVEGVRYGARRVELGRQFVEAEALGSFRFLRFAMRDGAPRARFRLIDVEGGVKYLDLLFEADRTGTYRLVDIYDFMQAEDMSALGRRILPSGSDGTTATPGQREGERRQLVFEFVQAMQREDWQTVLDLHPEIPPREADRKPLLVYYLQAASITDLGLYRKALDLFERDFGSDPDAALVLVDHHFLQGDTEAVLASIDAVDAGVGGDPYLDEIRANLYLVEGRLGEARAAADRLVEALPDLDEVYYPLLDVALAQGDFATVVRTLQRLERDFEIVFEPAVMKAEPAWAGFVASPSYKRWVAARTE